MWYSAGWQDITIYYPTRPGWSNPLYGTNTLHCNMLTWHTRINYVDFLQVKLSKYIHCFFSINKQQKKLLQRLPLYISTIPHPIILFTGTLNCNLDIRNIDFPHSYSYVWVWHQASIWRLPTQVTPLSTRHPYHKFLPAEQLNSGICKT